nr:syntaxin, N-terminal [Tanacetum cinerariifolium]
VVITPPYQELRYLIVSDHKENLLRRYYNKTCEYPNEAMVKTMLSGSGKVVEVLDWKKDLASETKLRHEAVNDIKRLSFVMALIFVMMEDLMLMEVHE